MTTPRQSQSSSEAAGRSFHGNSGLYRSLPTCTPVFVRGEELREIKDDYWACEASVTDRKLPAQLNEWDTSDRSSSATYWTTGAASL